MRILLDECVNPRVRAAFPGHEVKTVPEVGWRALKNSALLSFIEHQFDVFVTIDRGFEHEHNLRELAFGIVIAHVPKNSIEFYEPVFTELKQAAERVTPGHVRHVFHPALRR